MKMRLPLIVSGLLWVLSSGVAADVRVLSFEGVGDLAPVGDFYNGAGGPTLDLGISFGPNGLGLVDQDVPEGQTPGSGVFANEPTASTVLTFREAGAIVINVPAGFDIGFATYYVSTDNAFLRAWSGLDGQGVMLGELELEDQNVTGPGDPLPINGTPFGVWDTEGVTFEGVALSLTIHGSATIAAFDNLTFGSDVAGLEQTYVPVPEPASALLLATGVLALATARSRLRRQVQGH